MVKYIQTENITVVQGLEAGGMGSYYLNSTTFQFG